MVEITPIVDKYNPNIPNIFESEINNILTEQNIGISIGQLAKEWIVSKLSNLKTSDLTIKDIPLSEIIYLLIDQIQVRENTDTKPISYDIGWFNPTAAYYATIVEYGTQLEEIPIPAAAIIANMTFSQEGGSFNELALQRITESAQAVLSKIRV